MGKWHRDPNWEPRALRRKQCLEEMREVLHKIGPSSINKNYYADKYHFDWSTIDKWFTNILHDIPPEKICNLKIIGDAIAQIARWNLVRCRCTDKDARVIDDG